jgi:hypothetical protein
MDDTEVFGESNDDEADIYVVADAESIPASLRRWSRNSALERLFTRLHYDARRFLGRLPARADDDCSPARRDRPEHEGRPRTGYDIDPCRLAC